MKKNESKFKPFDDDGIEALARLLVECVYDLPIAEPEPEGVQPPKTTPVAIESAEASTQLSLY